MYTVQKISVTTRHTDGSPCYEYSYEYNTWRDLIGDMAAREETANAIFGGCGSHLFRGDELIGNIQLLWEGELGDRPTRQITLAQFRAAAA